MRLCNVVALLFVLYCSFSWFLNLLLTSHSIVSLEIMFMYSQSVPDFSMRMGVNGGSSKYFYYGYAGISSQTLDDLVESHGDFLICWK